MTTATDVKKTLDSYRAKQHEFRLLGRLTSSI